MRCGPSRDQVIALVPALKASVGFASPNKPRLDYEHYRPHEDRQWTRHKEMTMATELLTMTEAAPPCSGTCLARLAHDCAQQRERAAKASAEVLNQAHALRRIGEFRGIAAHKRKTPAASGTRAVHLAARRLHKLVSQLVVRDAALASQIAPLQRLLLQASHTMKRLNRLTGNPTEVSTIREGELARTQVGESHFRRLMESGIIGIMVGDTEHVIEANDAYLRLLGYTREDLFADRLRWSTLVAPEHLATMDHAVQEALTRGYCALTECEYVSQDRSRVQTIVGLARLERDLVCYVGFVVDVTERKRLERERHEAHANEVALREADRRQDEFLGDISHEFRTPLTSLQGYMQLLAQRFNAWEPKEDSVEDLASNVAKARTVIAYSANSVSRMTQLVNDLVDDARIREGRLALHPQPCDLSAIIRQAVDEQRMLAASRVIRLELPASQSAPIIADALRIGQVVTNYLTNALKYSKEHQPVEVRLEVEGDSARVYVHDDGVGIPHAEQQRVWERFHRAADVTVQSGSSVSLGLGLHINKNIVERHLGQVGVISAPGQGTTFWFALPLTKPGDTGSFHAR